MNIKHTVETWRRINGKAAAAAVAAGTHPSPEEGCDKSTYRIFPLNSQEYKEGQVGGEIISEADLTVFFL